MKDIVDAKEQVADTKRLDNIRVEAAKLISAIEKIEEVTCLDSQHYQQQQ